MKHLFKRVTGIICLVTSLAVAPQALAEDGYTQAKSTFQQANQTQKFFNSAYGYALFPTVGKGGIGIGAAYGKGRVYQGGSYQGDTSLSQVSFGFQIGGQAYSEVIFLKIKQLIKISPVAALNSAHKPLPSRLILVLMHKLVLQAIP